MFSWHGLFTVYVYVRKFSEKETMLFPEKNQEEICIKIISANDNWNLIQIYQDDNYSRKSACPQLNQLIKDAENGKLDLIITPEAERFGKDAIAAYELSQKLLEYGVGIQFVEMELSIFVQSLNPQNYAASVNGCSKRLL